MGFYCHPSPCNRSLNFLNLNLSLVIRTPVDTSYPLHICNISVKRFINIVSVVVIYRSLKWDLGNTQEVLILDPGSLNNRAWKKN